MNSWQVILSGWACMVVVMATLWGVQRVRGDAGIVDVAWGLGVGFLGAQFSALSAVGDPARRLLIAAMAVLWALRLSAHIAVRLTRLPEDGRYQSLKEHWGARAQWNLFLFFQLQAFWSMLFALPMWLAAQNPLPMWQFLDGVAVVIWLIAVSGEALADWELSAFRHNPAHAGQVCQRGLWRYSRHPNYFFEWLHWWAYVCLAAGSPWGGLALAGPAAMLYFLLKVTGVPPTEAQALKSRGDAYRQYQRTTSVFFPWPPQRGASE